jgi:uncharacterized integral membrane protein
MIRFLLAAPFLVLMILFALSNPQQVTLGLWPTDFSWEVPLSIVILLAMALGFVLGALMLWLSVLCQRSRARRAERTARALEAQVQELKARNPAGVPPAAALPALPRP